MKPIHDQGLLDTSVVVDLASLVGTGILPAESYISTVTLAELSVGPLIAKNAAEQIARQSLLQLVEAHFDPLAFDANSARIFGRLAAQLRASGRKSSAKAFDTLIAATAIQHELPLFTKNVSDFANIEGLVLVEVKENS